MVYRKLSTYQNKPISGDRSNIEHFAKNAIEVPGEEYGKWRENRAKKNVLINPVVRGDITSYFSKLQFNPILSK